MKKRLTSMIGFLLLFLLFSPLYVNAAETGSKDVEKYHAVHVDENTTEFDLQETCTEDEFTGWLWDRKSRSALNTSDTGLFGTQLTGLALEIYEGLSSVELGPDKNGVSITHIFADGETADDVYQSYRNAYAAALYAYGRDYHDLFLWWSNNKIGIGRRYNSSQITLSFYYFVSDYYTEDLKTEAEAAINSLVQACTGYNRETKLRYYHDWIVGNNDYDTPTSQIGESDDPEAFYYAHTAVGCLLKGKGVCESYSKLLKIFCLREGIPCLIITSNTHAWNYVKMEDGNWYMIDATWDDPIGGSGIYNTYFLVSNTPNIDTDHAVDERFQYPSTSQEAFQIAHDYILTERIEGTCVAGGSETYSCSHCGDSKIFELPADPSNHTGNVIFENRQEATCVTEGYTGDKYCKDCGAVLESGVKIPALGHSAGETVVENMKAPGCEEDGSYDEVVYCSICNIELSRKTINTSATGHNWDAGTVTLEPTGDTPGIKTYRCLTCGATKTESIPATNIHNYSESITKQPTCTEAGIKTFTCSDEGCTASYFEEIPPLGHSFTNYVSNGDASCEEDGTKTAYCDHECGAADTITEEGSALGHSYVVEVIKEASYVEAGEKRYTCERCGDTYTDEIPKPEPKDQIIRVARKDYSFTYNSAKAQSQSIGITGVKGRLSYVSRSNKIYVRDGKVFVAKAAEVKTYTVTLRASATSNGEYKDSKPVTLTIKVNKAANTIKVSPTGKTFKFAKVKKKAQSFKIGVTQPQGKVTYKSSNKKIKVTATGKVTVKKGTKKGKYKITVTAAGNKNYNRGVRTVIVAVK